MKKVANDRLRNSSKFIRRVLSKTSVSSNPSATSKSKKLDFLQMEINFESEIHSLKQQINKLQFIVNGMQNDTEKKEEALLAMQKERDKLASELNKERRENKKLRQQLDDEREFYYREKESYCKELNECKKLKRHLSKSNNEPMLQNELMQSRKEFENIKNTLNKTLEANYNLCVKFLRMKNTKHCLKSRLKLLQTSYDKLKIDSESNINILNIQLNEFVNNHLKLSIHPSNRRYLQVVKQSSSLIHENMCLKVEVDRLALELERLKMIDVKKETDSKLKFINSKTRGEILQTKASEPVKSENKEHKEHNEQKEHKEHKVKEKKKHRKKEHAIDEEHHQKNKIQEVTEDVHTEVVTKLYERKETVGVPPITYNLCLDDEKEYVSKQEEHIPDNNLVKSKEKRSKNKAVNVPPSIESIQDSNISMNTFYGTAENNKIESDDSVHSDSSCYPTEAIRTQSAPEIVQSSCFINQT